MDGLVLLPFPREVYDSLRMNLVKDIVDLVTEYSAYDYSYTKYVQEPISPDRKKHIRICQVLDAMMKPRIDWNFIALLEDCPLVYADMSKNCSTFPVESLTILYRLAAEKTFIPHPEMQRLLQTEELSELLLKLGLEQLTHYKSIRVRDPVELAVRWLFSYIEQPMDLAGMGSIQSQTSLLQLAIQRVPATFQRYSDQRSIVTGSFPRSEFFLRLDQTVSSTALEFSLPPCPVENLDQYLRALVKYVPEE